MVCSSSVCPVVLVWCCVFLSIRACVLSHTHCTISTLSNFFLIFSTILQLNRASAKQQQNWFGALSISFEQDKMGKSYLFNKMRQSFDISIYWLVMVTLQNYQVLDSCHVFACLIRVTYLPSGKKVCWVYLSGKICAPYLSSVKSSLLIVFI